MKATFDKEKFESDIKKVVDKWLTDVSNEIRKEVPDRIRSVFEFEGARDDHEEWKSTSTVARDERAEGAFHDPTLQDTKTLMDSIKDDFSKEPDGYVIVISTDEEWAIQHQIGKAMGMRHSKTGRKQWEYLTLGGKLPQREFLFLTKGDEEAVDEIIEDTDFVYVS